MVSKQKWYQRWYGVLWLVCVGVALGLSGCGQIETVNPLPEKGQTSFQTDENEGGGRSGMYGPAEDSAKAGAGPTSAQPAAPNAAPGAPSGRTGTVEEADLYRVSGQMMFYLNTYKGLTLFDLQDPKNPKKLYNLPVYGYPIEMFVEKNTVYALVRDALYLLSVNGKLQFQRRYVSQLVTIDISDPKKPQILQRFDIKGELREGVSRKIDNTIYVVTYTPRYYWWGWSYEVNPQPGESVTVYSFNVANPKDVKTVQTLELLKVAPEQSGTSGSSGSSSGSGTAPAPRMEGSRSFSDVTIAATSNALMVGEKWYVWRYNSTGGGSRCGEYESYQETVLHIVDISDVSGKIRVHTKFNVRGELGDQFKQTYIYEEDKKRGVYLGIFRRQEWSSANCQGEQVIRNTLISIDVSDGANPKVLSELAFGKPNETVRGSVFDTDRSVVFAITAEQIDPLYAISFKDPSNLKVLSEIDGLSGDINLFRFIENRQYLLAIGRDNSAACTGFGSEFVSTNLAASIIDVRDLSKIRLVQRRCIAIKGAEWVNSEINWNLDQAHKMIGMYSDGKLNLLTIPVSYHARGEDNRFGWWWYEYKSAIGIMQWDLSKYDPTKDHTQQKVLENIGTIIHPKGSVKRTIINNMQQNGGDQRLVINLSDTHMSLVDLNDLSKPQLLSTFEIAPYVRAIYRFGDYVVEQTTLGESYDQYNEFRVKKLGAADINDAAIETRFAIGQIRQVVRAGNYLLFFRYKMITRNEGKHSYIDYDYNTSDLLILDLTNPLSPKIRGSLSVPFPFIPYYRYLCGIHPAMDFVGGRSRYYPGYQSENESWTVTSDSMIAITTDYSGEKPITRLIFIDFSNPDKPAYQKQDLPTSAQYYNLVSLDAKTFYLSLRKEIKRFQQDDMGFVSYRYFVQPWTKQGQGWKAGSEINVPGNLLRAFRDGQKIKYLTQDYGYIRYTKKTAEGQSYPQYQYVFRLFLLEEENNLARLVDFKSFMNWTMRGLLLDGNRLYMLAGRDWYYMENNTSEKDASSDHLLIYDLSGSLFKSLLETKTLTTNLQLMGIYQQRLFLNLQGDGVLVADVRDPAQPYGLHFERTLGWLTHIEFTGDMAFLAAGHFGIYTLNLNQISIPQL